jgi:hypothetical protein
MANEGSDWYVLNLYIVEQSSEEDFLQFCFFEKNNFLNNVWLGVIKKSSFWRLTLNLHRKNDKFL